MWQFATQKSMRAHQLTDKENVMPQFIAAKGNSPSKMTEEEKVQYKNYLFRQSEEISWQINKQIKEIEEVRQDMKAEIRENK